TLSPFGFAPRLRDFAALSRASLFPMATSWLSSGAIPASDDLGTKPLRESDRLFFSRYLSENSDPH
ncbi:MAG: hypothetical protein AAF804_14055, partial [Bacteroidota bacterium]